MNNMMITSAAFTHNSRIPLKYTCDGANMNPPIAISGIPDGAKGVVLIMDDPDAPRGTWVHWTVWNISPSAADIPEGVAPRGGIEGVTSFGRPGYGGPCPPSGTHRYFFKAYALDAAIVLDQNSSVSMIERAMEGHVLASAELIGLYSRAGR
ncbi:MAG: YbhB/YbcL family Raf kinase inhibitor-like protein [Patescibacteria group bacterium]